MKRPTKGIRSGVIVAIIGTLLSACVSPSTEIKNAGLLGTSFAVTNTFQGAQTNNIETDVAVFGMTSTKFSKVTDNIELPAFITLYDIDVTKDAIKFNWIESEFSKKITGPTPVGNHDRNYFVFDLPEGKAIKSIVFDKENSRLLANSREPTAEILSSNRIVIDFSDGVIRGVGFNPTFKIVAK